MTADTRTPPTRSTDEAKPHQHRMAHQQGDAYVTALRHMADTVADAGGEQHAGDYIVAYAQEGAEGMYHLEDGELVWKEPGDANAHFEISVRDAADNRFIPCLDVTLTVVGPDGEEVGTEKMLQLWHPWLYHYGRNWTVPGDGSYTLRVRIEPPTFPRHDKENGKRYAEPVEVEFTDVQVRTG